MRDRVSQSQCSFQQSFRCLFVLNVHNILKQNQRMMSPDYIHLSQLHRTETDKRISQNYYDPFSIPTLLHASENYQTGVHICVNMCVEEEEKDEKEKKTKANKNKTINI